MEKKLDLSKVSLEENKLLSRAFETFNSSIEKLRSYQLKLESQIDELKHELEVKNHELTNILQSLPSGLIVTDLDGVIHTFNRSAQQITGIASEQALGKGLNDLMGHHLLPPHLDEEALAQVSHGFAQKFKFLKETETLVVESDTTLMLSEEQEHVGIIINLTDATLIDRLKEEAERKRRLAAMGEISMQVAHEVRNPLGSIELFVSMMKKDAPEGSEDMELIEHILGATRSINHIISNLLEYTRPKPITLDLVDMHGLISEFMDFSRHFANSQGIELRTELDAENYLLKGNRELIKQVSLNIFMNACQAMEEGGDFTLRTSSYIEKDPLILERFENRVTQGTGLNLFRMDFMDTGKGMSEEVKTRLFDPFFTTREQGTGLGMSIVFKTLASHGGTILVDSELGRGTQISLLFPQESEF